MNAVRPIRRWARLVAALTVIGGLGAASTAALPVAQDLESEGSYRQLADNIVQDRREQSTTNSVNRESTSCDATDNGLFGQAIDWSNPDLDMAQAWIHIEGTAINYPVAQATDDAPDFYLPHDLWGNESGAGCPYLDEDSSPAGRHALVYGHHLGTTGKMFGPLAKAWQTGEFKGLGNAVWSTRDGSQTVMKPLLSMRVDKAYEQVRTFDFADDRALRSWLREMAKDASCVSPAADELIGRACRALSLVTCSNTRAGMSQRTIVVFVA